MCDDLTDEESDQADDCAFEIILREIINNQNAQIQTMRGILDSKSYPEEDDCKVIMMGTTDSDVSPDTVAIVSPTAPVVPVPTIVISPAATSAGSSADSTADVADTPSVDLLDSTSADDLSSSADMVSPDEGSLKKDESGAHALSSFFTVGVALVVLFGLL